MIFKKIFKKLCRNSFCGEEMGGKRTRSSTGAKGGGGSGELCVCVYEQERQANIAKNEQRMAELGLLDCAESLIKAGRSKKGIRKPASASRSEVAQPVRRSSRLQGAPVPTYKEVSEKDISGVGMKRQVPEGSQPEYYTEEDEKLLGSYETAWELFVDGFGPDRCRIYDPVNGKTCHQCRQKTLGLRTCCSKCKALHGQFCGDCLFMRYGENVREALEKKDWVCPVCRGICNCSFCRPKRGWAPTGSLYRTVTRLGFKSVAHYLMSVRRSPATKTPEKDLGQESKSSAVARTRRSLNFPVQT